MEHIEVCDFVVDPMDGELREVASFNDVTVWLVDGGVMGREEVTEVLLPSDVL